MKLNRPVRLSVLLGLFCLPILGLKSHWSRQNPIVEASIKTDDVESEDDAADDPCVYINQEQIEKSLVIGTDKELGIDVYNLSGKRIQRFADGEVNNVDLRYDFPWNNHSIPLISTGNRTTNTIDFYYVDQTTNEVKRLATGVHHAGMEPYGSCMYKSPITQKMYVFVNSKSGKVIQWEVTAANEALLLNNVRRFDVGTTVEGCVVDDELQKFYISEERVGIWQYGAEPSDGNQRVMIDKTGTDGHLVADVEGLTIYRLNEGKGYLLASSQGENAFNIYRRENGQFIGKFEIHYRGKRIESTDGIDVTSHNLGDNFPFGMIVVQDGNRTNPRQSFKYASWLDISNKYSPPLELGNVDPILDYSLGD